MLLLSSFDKARNETCELLPLNETTNCNTRETTTGKKQPRFHWERADWAAHHNLWGHSESIQGRKDEVSLNEVIHINPKKQVRLDRTQVSRDKAPAPPTHDQIRLASRPKPGTIDQHETQCPRQDPKIIPILPIYGVENRKQSQICRYPIFVSKNPTHVS